MLCFFYEGTTLNKYILNRFKIDKYSKICSIMEYIKHCLRITKFRVIFDSNILYLILR